MIDSFTAIKSDLSKIATGTALAFAGAVFGNGITYLYGLVIARLLGVEAVGLYFLALVVMQFVSAVCRAGLPEGVLRFVAIHNGRDDVARVNGTIITSISVTAGSSLIAGLLLYVLAQPLSVHVLRQPALTQYLHWFAVALPFFSVFVLTMNVIQALKRMDIVVVVRDLLQPVAMLLLTIVLFYAVRASIVSFLGAYVLSVVVALAVALYALTRTFPALTQKVSAIFEWKTLLAFSLPIAVGDLANYLYRWSDTVLISFFRASTEVGIYNAALRTTLLLSLLAVSVNALYAPIIADHHHNGRHRELGTILRTLVRWCLTLALPIVLAMALLADNILGLWGPAFVNGVTAMRLLAVSQLLFIGSMLLAFTLLMAGRQYLETGNVLLITAVNITVNVILIPRYGILGAAITMVASETIALLLRTAEIHRVLGVQLYTPKYLKPILALGPAAILAIILKAPAEHIAASTVVGVDLGTIMLMLPVIAIVYGTTLRLLGLEDEDIATWQALRVRAPSAASVQSN